MEKTALTKKIKIGSLDRVITFRAATETQSDTGFPVVSWSDSFTDFAAIDYSDTSTESYQADRQIGVQRVNFLTRSNTNTQTVTNKNRIVLDGNEYDIEGITEPMGRGRFLKFHCKLRV